jgi:GH15 family glucan-1,4-alpha-glucosidase
VGNAASGQHQLDIFGDILNAAYQFRHGVEKDPRSVVPEPHERMPRKSWRLLRGMVEEAAANWREPDSGIWEVRDTPREYVYSKLMCWTALDRGIRLAQEEGLAAPLDTWRQARADVEQAILTRGYNDELGAFTQVLDGDELDASLLAIPRVGFLPANDPRMLSTIARIRQDLTRNGLVERYRASDGLPEGEGTFALCTFWMVDALALSGQQDEACALFEHLLSFRNDVGLLSEEIDPLSSSDQLLGNFPQGFSHMALIASAIIVGGCKLNRSDVPGVDIGHVAGGRDLHE